MMGGTVPSSQVRSRVQFWCVKSRDVMKRHDGLSIFLLFILWSRYLLRGACTSRTAPAISLTTAPIYTYSTGSPFVSTEFCCLTNHI
ncbi:hypothetical protein FA15DRAFT_316829 [Coprinopsis marcescibilis]|nr:hypothetical protein FA15DRAFT_316829 [Coprinopsis marcescibilis]